MATLAAEAQLIMGVLQKYVFTAKQIVEQLLMEMLLLLLLLSLLLSTLSTLSYHYSIIIIIIMAAGIDRVASLQLKTRSPKSLAEWS